MVATASEATRLLFTVALLCQLVIAGCTNTSEDEKSVREQESLSASDKASDVADAPEGKTIVSREEVQAYIRRITEQYDLHERGIRMKARDTEDGLRIVVLGEVENNESLEVLKKFFGSPYTNPDLPVPLVWKVSTKHD